MSEPRVPAGPRDGWIALTRPVSPEIGRCELEHLPRQPIDMERAASQHAAYEGILTALGCTVVRVEAAPAHPDSVFVEDTAVVVDEVAVATRPGAPSRRGEVAGVAEALSAYRPLSWIREPGTLDGGDVLRVGRTVFVGASRRTNEAGFAQLAAVLEPLGYTVRRVPVGGCLHLKSAATALDDGTVLVNPSWLPDLSAFRGLDRVDVDPDEPFAANVLRVGEAIVASAASGPRTLERIAQRGYRVEPVDLSELAKAEGAVTCCSIVLRAGRH